MVRSAGMDGAYGTRWLKAVAKITDADELLTFFDPAEHWLHLKTSNPIESSFSAVRLRATTSRNSSPTSTPITSRRHRSPCEPDSSPPTTKSTASRSGVDA